MLKHLLSSTGTDQPTQQEQYPPQQQFYNFAPPNIEYKYEEHVDPQQPVAPPHSTTNNNTICHEPPEAFAMNDDLAGFDGHSNTSDFLSSTFNLLTSDSTLVEHSSGGEWPQYAVEQMDGSKQQRVFYDPNPQLYYSQPNPYPPHSHYGSQHDEQVHQQQMHDMQGMRHTDSAEPAEKRAKKSGGQSARNCQLEYTENFKKFINIPTQNGGTAPLTNSSTPPQRSLSANNSDSGVQSPAESEESENGGQTISCPACKSVYSSPRSLTGHIGRTEKCRELIGRDYLDEITKMGKSGCIPDPSSVGEGISPVCPHCNRFISHYKGNIRRHINSCKKMPGRKDSGASAAEQAGSTSSNASLASYDTTSTPNPSQIEDHQTQPCSSNKDHSDYGLQPMHHSMHHHQPPIHAVHFAHPDERHIPPVHHHLPPYHLIPNAPVHHQLPPAQHQMTLITHLQPPHHLHQPAIHPSYAMEYMPYEPMHQQHMQPMPAQHYEITYVRTTPENPPPPAVHSTPIAAQNSEMSTIPKVPKLKHNGMVPVSDPYTCCWCAFSTVYKGNMKRHLISCHNCTDELLRKYNFELERLRKSNPHPATSECLPFIEIKPPQPPGTRRPRNPPNNKNLGRPKKAGSTSSEKSATDSNQPFDGQPPPEYMSEPPLQYGILPPQQLKMEYPTPPMGYMSAATPGLHPAPNGNPTYIIKDCANDSGLGMDLTDYGADVNSLHQPQALPGY